MCIGGGSDLEEVKSTDLKHARKRQASRHESCTRREDTTPIFQNLQTTLLNSSYIYITQKRFSVDLPQKKLIHVYHDTLSIFPTMSRSVQATKGQHVPPIIQTSEVKSK